MVFQTNLKAPGKGGAVYTIAPVDNLQKAVHWDLLKAQVTPASVAHQIKAPVVPATATPVDDPPGGGDVWLLVSGVASLFHTAVPSSSGLTVPLRTSSSEIVSSSNAPVAQGRASLLTVLKSHRESQ